MSENKQAKYQFRACILTFICMVSAIISWFLVVNQPSGMAAMYLIFPLGVTGLLHVLLGIGALVYTFRAGHHLHNIWIYLYYICALLVALSLTGVLGNINKSFKRTRDAQQNNREVALFQAIKERNRADVQHLSQSGANLEICFPYDRLLKYHSPLQYSIIYGTPETTQTLLDAGADPGFSCATHGGLLNEPLAMAIRGMDIQSVRALLAKGAVVSVPGKDQGLIAYAIAGGMSSISYRKNTSPYQAGKYKSAETIQIVQLLLAAQAPINASYQKMAPLPLAIAQGDMALFALLRGAGADPNFFGDRPSRRSPLTLAIEYDQPEMARHLILNEPRVMSTGVSGYKALLAAAKQHDTESIDLLLQAGFRISSLSPSALKEISAQRINPVEELYEAILAGDKLVERTLLSAGLDINTLFRRRGGIMRPLTSHVANDLEKLKKVVALGGDVNRRDQRGYTPLYGFAVCKYCVDSLGAIKNLLDLGADISMANNAGTTPLQGARQAGLRDVEEFLLAHGAYDNVAKP